MITILQEQIEVLRNKLAELQTKHSWKLIDDGAPRDGTVILISQDSPTPDYRNVFTAMYDEKDEKWITHIGWFECFPTHWQERPEPPVGEVG